MNKKIIEDYTKAVWIDRDLNKIYEVFSDEVIIHGPLGEYKSPRAMHEIVEKWHIAIPDMKVEFLHTLEDGNIVVSHFKSSGTHKNTLIGIEAKGNKIEYTGVTLYRMNNEKVVEYWAYINLLALQKQMMK